MWARRQATLTGRLAAQNQLLKQTNRSCIKKFSFIYFGKLTAQMVEWKERLPLELQIQV